MNCECKVLTDTMVFVGSIMLGAMSIGFLWYLFDLIKTKYFDV